MFSGDISSILLYCCSLNPRNLVTSVRSLTGTSKEFIKDNRSDEKTPSRQISVALGPEHCIREKMSAA